MFVAYDVCRLMLLVAYDVCHIMMFVAYEVFECAAYMVCCSAVFCQQLTDKKKKI